MADTNFRGPVNSMGALEVDAATASVQPMDGPSLFYQGNASPDIRSAPFAKDSFRPGQQAAFVSGMSVWSCDNIPQKGTTTALAAAQVGTAALAVALATVAVGGTASVAALTVGVPIIPLGTTVVTYVIALDFGFTTGTTVANSTTVTVVDNTVFHQGQWLIVGGAGNSAGTRSLVTQVQAIATANLTTITISPAAATGISNTCIGQGNLFASGLLPPGTQFGPAAASASAHSFGGAFSAGLARVMNPRETLARNISLTGATSVASYSCIVSGWDVWGNPMTELISMTTTTVVGKKAFKYIGSITSGTTTPSGTQTVAFGLGDTFGYPFRVDEWDQTEVTWNGSYASNFNGFSGAVITPASSTTGDVRGTIQLSTAIITGALTTAVSVNATNGTGRMTILQNIGVWNQMYGNPVNPVPMFGVAQSTATT